MLSGLPAAWLLLGRALRPPSRCSLLSDVSSLRDYANALLYGNATLGLEGAVQSASRPGAIRQAALPDARLQYASCLHGMGA